MTHYTRLLPPILQWGLTRCGSKLDCLRAKSVFNCATYAKYRASIFAALTSSCKYSNIFCCAFIFHAGLQGVLKLGTCPVASISVTELTYLNWNEYALLGLGHNSAQELKNAISSGTPLGCGFLRSISTTLTTFNVL